ncbi:hypothetical protein [Luteolibacter marinus]|uniref:hypothetical protein n=1 Tax=Luteolibacter marinus TaxID=2776705 RepID=UPI0018681433|nr:hypothetical protein [Luteolibacter marinus]
MENAAVQPSSAQAPGTITQETTTSAGKHRQKEDIIRKIPSEFLLAGAAFRRRAQVQGLQLLDLDRLDGADFVAHVCRGKIAHLLAARGGQEEGSHNGGVGQAGPVRPLRGQTFAKPSGSILPPPFQPPVPGLLGPAALVKFAEKIIEIPFLRALMALEGKQASDFFN